MVSLSQLQLSRVVEIVDNLVGLIWHFILLQIIPKVSNHLSSTYLHWWKVWASETVTMVSISQLQLSRVSPERLLTNLMVWSPIVLFFRFLTSCICVHAHLRLTAATGFRKAMVSLSQLQPSWVEIVDTLVGLIWHFILLQIPDNDSFVLFLAQLRFTLTTEQILNSFELSPDYRQPC